MKTENPVANVTESHSETTVPTMNAPIAWPPVRRFRRLPLLLMALFFSLPTVMLAQFNYTTQNGEITITRYTGPGGRVTIPDMIEGLPVTGIRTNSFYGNTRLTSVVIPGGVTSIGVRAFGFCASLTDISVDETNARYRSVDGVLFDKIEGTLLQFPAAKTGNYMIPDGITDVADGSFVGCVSLTSVVIPDSVTRIGEGAFYGCAGLADVIVGQSVTTIGRHAFYGCSSLRSVVIPDSVSTMGIGAFGYCTSLTSSTIGSGLTTIEAHAFRYCVSLTDVVIPDSVTSVGDWAFGYCWDLAEIVIPENLTTIGNGTFSDCSALSAITVNTRNSVYSSLDGVLFNKLQSKLVQYPAGKTGSYSIPNSVTSIGDWTFYGCTGLTRVVIPDTVTRIGSYAFSYCTGLTSVVIPDTITSIGAYTFAYCRSLPDITIPDSVVSIGTFAFRDCDSLTSIVIPDSVIYIGRYAFFSCIALTHVMIGDGVVNIGKEAFNRCTSLTGIYFRGDAPRLGSSVFKNLSATVYYLSGTAGWDVMFGGLLTEIWVLTVPATIVVLGVVENQFVLSLNGTGDETVFLEASSDLVDSEWRLVEAITLIDGSARFSDPDWEKYPSRFYRLHSP